MDSTIVTFEQFVKSFPRITNKSKVLAKRILPLHASPELAALVAALMTDGHVEWYTSDGNSRAKKIILYLSNKAECEWFFSLVLKVFGTEGQIQAYKPKSGYFKKQPYKAFVSSATITQILILAGSPIGNKTEKEFLIPNWIMDSNSEIKSRFLQTFFTFEASKPRVKTNREFSFEISLTMVKTKELLGNAFKFFSQIKKLLAEFEVISTRTIACPTTNGVGISKYAFGFSITNQFSIINFYRHIGYFNPEKQRVLKKIVLKISKFGRLKSSKVCALIGEIKIFFLLFSLIKMKTDKAILNELPNHIIFLYSLDSSVPLCP